MKQEIEKYKMYKEILCNQDEIHIWKELDNGCYIGTMGYSKRNVPFLKSLLKSFDEQYGEKTTDLTAAEELKLYKNQGKLFIYFDEHMNPVSMNGCIYNYENDTVDFIGESKSTSLYFYGLSTLKSYRGKGACNALIQFAIEFAYYNQFDFVYARTDLINSNSEWIMAKNGMELCTHGGKIIAEWVEVNEENNIGDWRLHMWKPLKEDIYIRPKGNYELVDCENRIEPPRQTKEKEKSLYIFTPNFASVK